MPEDPDIQYAVYRKMLDLVEEAIISVPENKANIERLLAHAQEQKDIPNIRELLRTKLELRMQELCLYDQRDRLKGRIERIRGM
jgi:rhamnose utilization protein RhaD (predicted bifunctional aldolase and dehydrogenase)